MTADPVLRPPMTADPVARPPMTAGPVLRPPVTADPVLRPPSPSRPGASDERPTHERPVHERPARERPLRERPPYEWRGTLRTLARRVDAATPEHRDRAVDALRAFAILGVVLGHWLVTALVPAGSGDGGRATWNVRSPLSFMPWLAPVSWVLQTLALFFFVGGYSAARSLRRPANVGGWVRARMVRLCRPAAVLVAAWAPITLVLMAAGVDPMPLVRLMLSPLWFLCVFAGLTALTPLLARCGPYAAAVAAALVACVDLVRFGLDGPAWVGWLNVPAAWAVPYLLGIAWAKGRLGSRRTALALLVGGAAAAIVLVAFAGYPATMVGLPGARVSNLSPPTTVAVAFGLAQVGAALLLRDRLARWMRRPFAWAPVALANLSAMTVFCWHQTAFMLVTVATRPFGRLPGLHDVPDHWSWIPARMAWLPAFALVLAGCRAAFRRFERNR
ncbi:acyltransferase family protein [Actinoallomurus purpureus]|uniref:acyltransferase family protein n=1 Tax=Actinoallomurus purpureus TaxID=478114 RepID=UPI002093000F|nr:acyltransferase [Actinoallomurus purpureus]MCO6008794.1 acyltransferase family protein [Actinoallomurus purpureus]